MSDDFIVLIPVDPKARLDADTLARLETAHKDIVGAEVTRTKDYGDRLQFIDCGGNFEEIRCPFCGQQVDTDWWGNRMDHDWDDDKGFHLCLFDTPCCGAETRLDKLDYRWPQGFSTWFVSAMNVNRGPLTISELGQLEKVAGVPLKVIYQHY